MEGMSVIFWESSSKKEIGNDFGIDAEKLLSIDDDAIYVLYRYIEIYVAVKSSKS